MVPKFDEYNIIDLKEIDQRAFRKFSKESQQDPLLAARQMEAAHILFSGQLQKGKREGKGAVADFQTGDFYFGGWQADKKSGTGILFMGPKTSAETNFFARCQIKGEAELFNQELKEWLPGIGMVRAIRPLVYKGGF